MANQETYTMSFGSNEAGKQIRDAVEKEAKKRNLTLNSFILYALRETIKRERK